MRVRREEFIKQPFVLTSNDLNKLYVNLQKWLNKIDFEISCKDSLKREFSSLEDLLKFENSPQKDIQSLRINGYTHDPHNRIYIMFGVGSSDNIYITLEGEEDAAMAINNSLEECLSAIKPWYHFLAHSMLYPSFIIALSLSLVIMYGLITGIIKMKPGYLFDRESLSGFSIVLFGFVLLGFGCLFYNIKEKFFPLGVFAIGQGDKRHRDKEIIRTVIIIGFFISLIAGIISYLIFA